MGVLSLDVVADILLCGVASGVLAELVHFLALANCWVTFVTLWLVSAATCYFLATLKVSTKVTFSYSRCMKSLHVTFL